MQRARPMISPARHWTTLIGVAAALAGGCDGTLADKPDGCGGEVCADNQRCVAGACRNRCDDVASCSNGFRCEGGLCLPAVQPPTARSAGTSNGAGTGSNGTTGSSAHGAGSGAATTSRGTSTSAPGTAGSSGVALASSRTSSSGPGVDAGTLAPAGTDCSADAQCQSGMCRQVFVAGVPHVCVSACTQQSDCGAGGNLYCSPTSPGASAGTCVPRSPVHCARCATHADCGGIPDACVQVPGESVPLCHVDCSLAGQDACPTDYSCSNVTVAGQPRSLCLPRTGSCDTAEGGFCDRVTTPLPCDRHGAAGTCTGNRTCQATTSRYTTCSAPDVVCLASCGAAAPAGCTLAMCAGATTSVDNCGACGVQCPGSQRPGTVVTCSSGQCTFACQGENYDVNDLAVDGCEVADAPLNNHSQALAINVGSYPCGDGSSQQNTTGRLPADTRTHSPVVSGRVANGTAPDWFSLRATGGLCVNDANLHLLVTGSTAAACFRLTLFTTVSTYVCNTAADGTCDISNGSGSYDDDTDLFMKVEKTCTSPGLENAAFHITGHL